MKKKLILVGILAVTVLFPLPGAAAETPKSPAGRQDQRKDRAEESDESMEERLRKLGRELDELRAKIKPMTEEARKEMERYTGEARKRQKEAAVRLKALGRLMEKKWKDFSTEMNDAIEQLEQELEREERRSRRDEPASSDRTI